MSKKKVWKILDGTYKKPIGKKVVEWVIAGIQHECEWTERDIQTFDSIQKKEINWSGYVPKKK